MSAFAAQWWTNEQSVFSNCEIWELLSLAREQGHDLTTDIGGFRYVHRELLRHSGRLSWDNYIEIVRILANANNGKLPSGFARRLHLQTYGIPGIAILTSPTLREAIETVMRFAVLLNIKFPVDFNSDGIIRLRIPTSDQIDPKTSMLLFEIDVFKIHNFIEDIIPHSCINKSIYVCGYETKIDEFNNFINDFLIKSNLSEITVDFKIPQSQLLSPLHSAVAETHSRCLSEGNAALDNLRETLDIEFAIISRLQHLDIGVPTMAEIAADLNMSERTLRRKLIKLNTSFSELRDQVRIALAAELLLDSTQSTEDVAERLGYSDAANFRHAFKRWHGEPPSFFRKKMARTNLWVTTQGYFGNCANLDCSETSKRESR
ncbi:MAG: AraC family transcriptional regulator [Sphingomonadaceae bacterium]|jgi:AraC-like DNA-binding protein|nr:AraC family transcriptional regulator [Sphingomonadaceae bacterium]